MPSRPSDERRVRAAAVRRRILIRAMGSVCEDCGSGQELEFHHVEERTWVASKLSRWERQARYEQEWADGQLLLLCADCNKVHGKPQPADAVPF